MTEDKQSWYSKILGRSFLSVVFGGFFEKKNNTGGIIAILLVGTLCYVIVFNIHTGKEITEEIKVVSNIIFVVIGYYFGAKSGVGAGEKDDTQ